jgi:Reverse transcriptase (RNA-dependent DNA polymerase)
MKGAFLKGRFTSDDEVLMLEVPQGFRWVYDKLGDTMIDRKAQGHDMTTKETMEKAKEIFQEWQSKTIGEKHHILKSQMNPKGGSNRVYLQMQTTIYGSVQVVRAFWIELQRAFQAMGYKRSESDPCIYTRWDENGNICVWLTWIDDCIAIGKKSVVERECAQLMSLFDCDDVGLMKEYIRNKIEIGNRVMKMTQPVLLKSFVDEFEVSENCRVNLPAKAGQVLIKGKEEEIMNEHMTTRFRSGVGNLRYLATWSRLDILNAVREISRHMKAPTKAHYQAMIQVMEYCVTTSNRGRKNSAKGPMGRNKGLRIHTDG